LPKPLFALILIAAPLGAEFLHIEQSLTGLDCISCAESVGKNLKKIRGVESASFRTADSVAVVDLKPGNTVALADVRDRVKGMGYTPKEAKVTARGEARMEAGKWMFHLAGSDTQFMLEVSESAADTLGQGGAVIIEGGLAEPSGPLKVTSARRE
jgi:cation transport ATPase